MRPAGRPLVVAVALPEEAAALRRRLAGARRVRGHRAWRGRLAGREVVLLRTGDGAERAGQALRRLLAAVPCSGIVGGGVAGGLAPDLAEGSVVAATRVVDGGSFDRSADGGFVDAAVAAGATAATALSAPEVAFSAADKTALASASPACAVVDLESAAWAAAAEDADLPWVVVRAVSDARGDDLPELLRSCVRRDGSIGRGRAALRAVLDPASLPGLLRLRRRVLRASTRLATVLEGMMERPFRNETADATAKEAV